MKAKFVKKDEEKLILKSADWFTMIIIQKKKKAIYEKLKN